MTKDNRKFMISVDNGIVATDVSIDDFNIVVKDLLYHGFDLDQIRVWCETSFRLVPERYEVD